jgi:anti-anti-sigma regulatory factor
MGEPARSGTPALADARAEEVAVVYAGDYVNKLNGQRLERECRLRIEGGARAVVINFRDTELVNSIGVSILLGIVDIAESRGARLVFTNLNRHNQKLFELLGITRCVMLAESEEDALATLAEFAAPAPRGH